MAVLNSIPYRFFPVTMVLFLPIVVSSARDLAAMREAEQEALATEPDEAAPGPDPSSTATLPRIPSEGVLPDIAASPMTHRVALETPPGQSESRERWGSNDERFHSAGSGRDLYIPVDARPRCDSRLKSRVS